MDTKSQQVFFQLSSFTVCGGSKVVWSRDHASSGCELLQELLRRTMKRAERKGRNNVMAGICMQVIHCDMVMDAMRDEAI